MMNNVKKKMHSKFMPPTEGGVSLSREKKDFPDLLPLKGGKIFLPQKGLWAVSNLASKRERLWRILFIRPSVRPSVRQG
jgi:hypothetical protein